MASAEGPLRRVVRDRSMAWLLRPHTSTPARLINAQQTFSLPTVGPFSSMFI